MPQCLREASNWYWLRLKVYLIEAWVFLTKPRIVGDAPVTVSLTTHGRRLAMVHTSILSIGMGTLLPSRIILWLNHEKGSPTITRQLRWLQKRGLEIKYTTNYGPHTKYYPYVASIAEHTLPLATADDDVMYGKDWLERLMEAHTVEPDLIHCHWALRMKLCNGRILPYLEWKNVQSRTTSSLNFALGVSGVIYPPKFLMALRAAGDEFMSKCPKADDIWLHVLALRNGYKIKKISEGHKYPDLVPYTQEASLWSENVLPNGNDMQIAATYTPDDVATLVDELGAA